MIGTALGNDYPAERYEYGPPGLIWDDMDSRGSVARTVQAAFDAGFSRQAFGFVGDELGAGTTYHRYVLSLLTLVEQRPSCTRSSDTEQNGYEGLGGAGLFV